MRDMYTRLSLVESTEDNLYEDEYDDTYDEAAMAVGDEGETERQASYFMFFKIIYI